MSSNNVKNSAIIWTKTTCPYCIKAKQLLKNKNIPFIEYDLLKGSSRDEFIKTFPGVKTVPQIILNGKYIGGCTDLEEYFKILERNNLFYNNLIKLSKKKVIKKRGGTYKRSRSIKKRSNKKNKGKTYPDDVYTDLEYQDNRYGLRYLENLENKYEEEHAGTGDHTDGSPTIEGYDYGTFRSPKNHRKSILLNKLKRIKRSIFSKKF